MAQWNSLSLESGKTGARNSMLCGQLGNLLDFKGLRKQIMSKHMVNKRDYSVSREDVRIKAILI